MSSSAESKVSSTSTNSSTSSTTITNTSVSPPRRFIFSPSDMAQFINSPAKRDLLSFITSLGRSTSTSSYTFDYYNPLIGLSPGMASLHGSLRAMATQWLKDIPPDEKLKARFGNPMFKVWHARSMSRSRKMIQSIMECHLQHVVQVKGGSTLHVWDMNVLKQCSEAGYQAALEDYNPDDTKEDNVDSKQDTVILELQAYWDHAFGHEVRLDYGTGHECSFYIFIYVLCKIGIFGNPKTQTPSVDIMAPVALSISSQYLEICRGLQTDYMLEPAGSHGVWGLDDYHCIPFYIGACQLQNKTYDDYDHKPSSIHNDELLRSDEAKSIIYFQCIYYIKNLKKGVPFFESSPMLNDISQLANWGKVSGGLLRLFEGEVLSKKPVVQHFVFGDIFKASWTPTEVQSEAPTRTFDSGNHVGMNSNAPWAIHGSGKNSGSSVMPPTKAPWAK